MYDQSLDTKGMTIMVVDDTTANIDVLKKTLEPGEYSLSFATCGKKAIDLATHNIPDLILLDIMMPDIDGFEVCNVLKRNKKTKDIPIIFITAKTEVENLVKGFEVGGIDYITKPFRSEEVRVRVRTQLQLALSRKYLKDMHEYLEKSNQLLKETNKIKNTFIGMALGDLRNPKKFESIIKKLRESHQRLRDEV